MVVVFGNANERLLLSEDDAGVIVVALRSLGGPEGQVDARSAAVKIAATLSDHRGENGEFDPGLATGELRSVLDAMNSLEATGSPFLTQRLRSLKDLLRRRFTANEREPLG